MYSQKVNTMGGWNPFQSTSQTTTDITNEVQTALTNIQSSTATCNPSSYVINSAKYIAPTNCPNGSTFTLNNVSTVIDMDTLTSCVQQNEMTAAQQNALQTTLANNLQNQMQSFALNSSANNTYTKMDLIQNFSEKVAQTYTSTCHPNALIKKQLEVSGYCNVSVNNMQDVASLTSQMSCLEKNMQLSTQAGSIATDLSSSVDNKQDNTVAETVDSVGNAYSNVVKSFGDSFQSVLKELQIPLIIMAIIIVVVGIYLLYTNRKKISTLATLS